MLTVATWNLENLFLGETEEGPASEEVFLQKIEKLARTIRAIGPDVIAVQEVGQPEALHELAGQLDGEWHTIVSEHPDGRGIRVGFLSFASGRLRARLRGTLARDPRHRETTVKSAAALLRAYRYPRVKQAVLGACSAQDRLVVTCYAADSSMGLRTD